MYRTEDPFEYAKGYYGILPTGLPDRFYNGDGENVFTEDYVIYFKPNTPKKIRDRFVKEYAEFYKKELELGHY